MVPAREAIPKWKYRTNKFSDPLGRGGGVFLSPLAHFASWPLRGWNGPFGEVGWCGPISAAGPDAIFLGRFARQFYLNGAPAPVRIGLRIIAQRIKVGHIGANRIEGFVLVAPLFGEIRLAAGGRAHLAEDRSGNNIECGL